MKPGLRAAAFLTLVGVTGLPGCGYTVRGALPSHIKTISVPIFANRTQQPGVEGFITRAIVEAFSTNGQLRLAPSNEADAVLDGEITDYSVGAIAFDQSANITIYRLVVSLNLKLRDVREKKILFSQDGVREQADFRVQGAVSATISREQDALSAAAVDIGRSVVSLTIQRF